MKSPGPPTTTDRQEQAPNGDRAAAEPTNPSEDGHGLICVEWCPICRTADALRETTPPDQWQRIQREALGTMRALIDRYLEGLDETADERHSGVEDIPLE